MTIPERINSVKSRQGLYVGRKDHSERDIVPDGTKQFNFNHSCYPHLVPNGTLTLYFI